MWRRAGFLVVIWGCSVLAVTPAILAKDTDGDGLFDLMDVPGFDPSATGSVYFDKLGIQDLDGVNLLTNIDDLVLRENQITSIEPGDFQGLANLTSLSLSDNQISSIDVGDLQGLHNLRGLYLGGNPIVRIQSRAFERSIPATLMIYAESRVDQLSEPQRTEYEFLDLPVLNFTGADFSDLDWGTYCEQSAHYGVLGGGFCVLANIDHLVLDDATVATFVLTELVFNMSFQRAENVSLVGITITNEYPGWMKWGHLGGLAATGPTNLTVDQAFYAAHTDELNAYRTMADKTITVVPGLCDVNRDTICDVTDIDAMTQQILALDYTSRDLQLLIHRDIPHGFRTYFGDANLDGQFNIDDLATVLAAGEYEDDIVGNSGWATGDWNGDAEFTSDDLTVALADGGYEAGPRPAAVPEPRGAAMLFIGLCSFFIAGRRDADDHRNGSTQPLAEQLQMVPCPSEFVSVELAGGKPSHV